MFSLSNVVCNFLPDQITETYRGEIQLAEKMLYSGVSLTKHHPLSKTAAKTADTALGVFKSLVYVEKGSLAIKSLPNLMKVGTTEAVTTLASAVLLPFSVINLVETVKSLDFVHEIFAKVPVFGLLKFSGVTNFAVIALSCSLLSKFYQKETELQKEKTNIGKQDDRKALDLKITINRITMVETAAKISSLIIFMTIDVLTYTHPSITFVKISFIAVEIICNSKKYYCTEASTKAA